jgi:hypothetical protein
MNKYEVFIDEVPVGKFCTLQEAEQKCYDHINDTTNDEVHVEIVKTKD